LVTPLSREDRILGSVKPFRLSTPTEISVLRKVFVRISGLKVGQFAENGFGFPFIPFPEIDAQNPNRTKLSPANTSSRFLFHPIYWVDPRITQPTEAEYEDPARWSIRMFYELLSFGLLNPETLQWLNPAMVKGINYTPSDVNNLLNDAPSVLDSVRFHDEDRLPGYSSSEVLDAADVALERVRAIQHREVERSRSLRDAAMRDAAMILGGNDRWAEIFSNFQANAAALDEDRKNGFPISRHVDTMYASKAEVSKYLSSAEDAVVGLSIDLADSASYSNEAVVRFAAIASLIKRGKGLISKTEQQIDEQLRAIFAGDKRVGASNIALQVSSLYSDMVDRLSLAYRNHELNTTGQRVIRSVDERMFDEDARTEQASEKDFTF